MECILGWGVEPRAPHSPPQDAFQWLSMVMALLRTERSQKGTKARSAQTPQGGRRLCSEEPEQGEGCGGQLGRGPMQIQTQI